MDPTSSEEWRDLADFPGYQVSNLGNERRRFTASGHLATRSTTSTISAGTIEP